MLLEIGGLIIGLALLIFSSEKAVENSVKLAKSLKISPFIIGVVLISFGTDIPEITNSIISSFLGHGDINVGNILGSPLAQITLVLGIVGIFGGIIIVKKSVIKSLGLATVAATLLALLLISDGNITRVDAVALIISYIAFIMYLCNCDPRQIGIERIKNSVIAKREKVNFLIPLAASILGVIAGSSLVVNSVIELSKLISIPEFLLSFFVIGLGTSLPELAFELSAVKKRQFGLAIGDAFGSNITDLTLALGIGPLFFPNTLSTDIVGVGGLYLLFATFAVVALIAWRKKIDRVVGILLVLIYLASYFIIPNL
jgi:cation:H+ antiporter